MEQNENAEEWMDHQRLKANECGYKEKEKSLKVHFINGISDDEMMIEIIRELTVIKETNKVMSE